LGGLPLPVSMPRPPLNRPRVAVHYALITLARHLTEVIESITTRGTYDRPIPRSLQD
jgi:hypothetical protein